MFLFFIVAIIATTLSPSPNCTYTTNSPSAAWYSSVTPTTSVVDTARLL